MTIRDIIANAYRGVWENSDLIERQKDQLEYEIHNWVLENVIGDDESGANPLWGSEAEVATSNTGLDRIKAEARDELRRHQRRVIYTQHQDELDAAGDKGEVGNLYEVPYSDEVQGRSPKLTSIETFPTVRGIDFGVSEPDDSPSNETP